MAAQGERREGSDHHLRNAHLRRARRLANTPNLPHRVSEHILAAPLRSRSTRGTIGTCDNVSIFATETEKGFAA